MKKFLNKNTRIDSSIRDLLYDIHKFFLDETKLSPNKTYANNPYPLLKDHATKNKVEEPIQDSKISLVT